MPDAVLDLEPHLRRLNRYAQRLTHNRTYAEDLVQDTVVRALTKAHLFEQNTDLRRWLMTIMHNEHVNAARRYFKAPVTVPDVALDTIGCDETQTAPVELREVRRALGRLPSDQRQVLLLRSVLGLKYEEIAGRLGLPIGTVQSRISRARKSLHEMLAQPDSGLGLANPAAALGLAPDATQKLRAAKG
jgi:RNA polymerase sigma-70 factor (ECF subfamily)